MLTRRNFSAAVSRWGIHFALFLEQFKDLWMVPMLRLHVVAISLMDFLRSAFSSPRICCSLPGVSLVGCPGRGRSLTQLSPLWKRLYQRFTWDLLRVCWPWTALNIWKVSPLVLPLFTQKRISFRWFAFARVMVRNLHFDRSTNTPKIPIFRCQ